MADKVTGPLFKWFGSKWLSSKLMPVPRYDLVCEPFAGSAGYALRHRAYREAHLAETDPHVRALWQWLITFAEDRDILEIPLGIPEGTDIRSLGLSKGQSLLLKTWQRTNNVGNCWTISPWGNKPGQWTANTRARVAAEVYAVKKWSITSQDYYLYAKHAKHLVSWFIDPPYQYNYQYKSAGVRYDDLGAVVRSLSGQVIVCEARCPKTGRAPTWLPFEAFGDRVTSRRKAYNNHHSKELIYVRQGEGTNGYRPNG